MHDIRMRPAAAASHDQGPAIQMAAAFGTDPPQLHVLIPASPGQSARTALRSVAAGAAEALAIHGASVANVVRAKVLAAGEAPRSWRRALGPIGARAGWLIQPPTRSDTALELLLWACPGPCVEADEARGVRATEVRGRDGSRHLWLDGVHPRRAVAGRSFREAAADVFAAAAERLAARGLSFADVVRTWIYVRDIGRDYAALNDARNAFFRVQGIERLPASTGIAGTVGGESWALALDLYAVRPGFASRVAPVKAAPLCAASSYGSAFARGATVSASGATAVYVSGTASVDRRGRVVAAGSLAGQIRRTLVNLRALLAAADLRFTDTISAVAYVTRPASGAAVLRALHAAGVPSSVPCPAVVAAVCRPEWLCEVELIAAKPSNP